MTSVQVVERCFELSSITGKRVDSRLFMAQGVIEEAYPLSVKPLSVSVFVLHF